MAPTRKSFSAKFKAEALKYVEEKGCLNCAASRHFGIDENDIRGWKVQSDSLHTMIKNGFSKAKQKYLVRAGDHFQRTWRSLCISG